MRYLFILSLLCIFFGCDITNRQASESLVYTSNRDGNADLYGIDALGQWEKRLTSSSVKDWYPKWNQGTARLIYRTGLSPKSFITVSMSMESNQTDTLQNGKFQDFQLSPDGKRVFYTQLVKGGQHIWLCNLDGTDMIKLTKVDAYNGHFSISPEGDRLLFVSDRSGQNELYLLNLQSKALLRLTDNAQIEQYSTWSPDGKKVAFTMRTDDEESKEDIYMLDLNNNEIKQLTNTPYAELELAWSFSGEKIAFRGATDEGDHIYTIDLADGKFTKITSGNAYHAEPIWIPIEL